jgi:hypothetical protein
MHNSCSYRPLPVERVSKSENHLSGAKSVSASDGGNGAKWNRDGQRRKIEFPIARDEPSRRSQPGRELHIMNLRIRDMRICDDQSVPPYCAGSMASLRPADLDRYLAHTRSHLAYGLTQTDAQLTISIHGDPLSLLAFRER